METFMEPLTEVQKYGQVWFKREDKFLPFGPDTVNGSKVRQAIYLMNRHIDTYGKPDGVISAASMRSAQLPLSVLLANSMGVPCVIVVGATKPETAPKHDMVALANHYGAKFIINKVGYNPALQKRAKDFLAEHPSWMYLEYGSSLDHHSNSPEEIERFHRQTAKQLNNMPPEVKRLIVPTGSCNTLTSVMYGLAMHQTNIEEVICLQIGPDKRKWTDERLAMIEQVSGHKINTPRIYHDLTIHWKYEDLEYVSDLPGGITFHPTYEGKCWSWLESMRPDLLTDKPTCFWMTGAKPDYHAVAGWKKPERIELYGSSG